jgi:hypothetical protein
LSLAFAETVIVPESVEPLAGAVIETVGGVVSTEFCTTTEMEELLPTLPFASVALARRVWVPFADFVVSQTYLYGEAVNGLPTAAPSSWNCTLVTLTLSATAAKTVTLPDSVAPTAGEVIATVGAVVLLGALLLALTKPVHPVLKNARLTTPTSANTYLVPNSTAPLEIRKALIDLLKSLLS